MKTIIVKDIAKKLTRDGRINLRQIIPAILFLGAMFLLGRAAAETLGEIREATGLSVRNTMI